MSALPDVRPTVPPVRHATAEEYRAFVMRRGDVRSGANLLRAYRRFVRRYPDLGEWFSAPLAERVGRTWPRSGQAYISAAARPYLYYLAARGLAFDWEWVIAAGRHLLTADMLPPAVTGFIRESVDEAVGLGYRRKGAVSKLSRTLKAIYLHRPAAAFSENMAADITGLEQSLVAFGQRPDLHNFFSSEEAFRRHAKGYREAVYALRLVLYHRSLLPAPPVRTAARPLRVSPRSLMEALLERYLWARRVQHARPTTLRKIGGDVRRFIDWLAREHPGLESFAEVTRDQALAYSASLDSAPSPRSGRPLSVESKITCLSSLSVFFRDTTSWDWVGAPRRPLLGSRDLPKRPRRIPRYIPADQLNRLMSAVRQLQCPYQRTALIVARWSGARRGEIRSLDFDCLDSYPEGTPRLRIPVGKGRTERLVPLHEEAAAAIRELQRVAAPARGFRDEQTGAETRRLFVYRGLPLSVSYLFETALAGACAAAGLVDNHGRPLITAHRFRHTVGTELAEGGARLHTIMRMLGHTSTEMTLVYAHISDRAMTEDYRKVLGPGAELAGPLAADLRAGSLPEESVEWLKTNFFKTELELGHCLRLPSEGPCECDLYLSCAKFVTTREYAPRLRARRLRELELAGDAASRGWEREMERHRCAAARIEQLLGDLDEPLEEGEHAGG
jgi:integrase